MKAWSDSIYAYRDYYERSLSTRFVSLNLHVKNDVASWRNLIIPLKFIFILYIFHIDNKDDLKVDLHKFWDKKLKPLVNKKKMEYVHQSNEPSSDESSEQDGNSDDEEGPKEHFENFSDTDSLDSAEPIYKGLLSKLRIRLTDEADTHKKVCLNNGI